MHTLFNIEPLHTGIYQPPFWNYVKDGLARNVEIVRTYYQNNPGAVVGEHFLVRLLQTISVSQGLPTEQYYNAVDAMALNHTMALGMTSSRYTGKLFNGIFYGKGNTEILIAHDTPFSATEVTANWKDTQAIQVLRHPRSDLGLNLLDGRIASRETGIVVLAINVTMLAVQYRAFRYDQIRRFGQDESQQSIMQFISMYVLPNMLISHLDIAIVNRFYKLLRYQEPGFNDRKLPFYLTDFGEKADSVLQELLGKITVSNYRFDTILRTIPAVFTANALETLALPRVAPTRQVLWALVLSRLENIEMLFRIHDRTRSDQNRQEIGKILRKIVFYRSDNTFRQALTSRLFYQVEDTFDLLKELAEF